MADPHWKPSQRTIDEEKARGLVRNVKPPAPQAGPTLEEMLEENEAWWYAETAAGDDNKLGY